MPYLKVYGTRLHGKHRAIVAAPTKKKAAMSLRMSDYDFRQYGSETRNPVEIEVAMREPGNVFVAPLDKNVHTVADFERWDRA